MVNIRQLRSVSPPSLAELQDADTFFVASLMRHEAAGAELNWLAAPYPSTFWAWWDRSVALRAVDAWISRGKHGEMERLVARWLLASPGSSYDRLTSRPNDDAYPVAMDRALRLIEPERPQAGLSTLEIWVNLYDQWGKHQSRKGRVWAKLISRAHHLNDKRRQLCVWGRFRGGLREFGRRAGGTRERGGGIVSGRVSR